MLFRLRIMCGICGIVSFAGIPSPEEVQRMSLSLAHRGPDDQGQWVSEDKNVILGHRRLSIIDLSPRGRQPLTYRDQRYSITYNGEIYNYLELKRDLISEGYVFNSETDTEVLLALYDQKGRDCLQYLDGMFAFAIWDEKKKELFCARDRFGEKPFYYTIHNDKFYFASEIKAFWSVGISREANLDIVYNYLVFGSIRDVNRPNKTFFRNIESLPPSNAMTLKLDRSVEMFRYWDLDTTSSTSPITEKDAILKFQELFDNSVKIRLRSDVAVGSSLSGGIDSSSIVSSIHRNIDSREKQLTFSAIFPGFEKDEGSKIEEMHRSFSSIKGHFVKPNIDSVKKNLMDLVHFQDEPFGSFSISAQYEVMKLAKENSVKVLLDGQGADESLGGYIKYYQTYLSELRRSDKNRYDEEYAYYKKYFDENGHTSIKSRIQRSHPKNYRQLMTKVRAVLPVQSKIFKGLNPDIVGNYRTNEPASHVPSTLKEGLYYSMVQKDLAELLRYSDRNSMAHSVEVRLPFLSHHLIDFIFSLPNTFLIRNGWTKYILRIAMGNRLPEKIAWDRNKIGFEPPHGLWLQDEHFQDLIDHYSQKLLAEKVITKIIPDLQWKYLMIGLYMEN